MMELNCGSMVWGGGGKGRKMKRMYDPIYLSEGRGCVNV
jgi:hypothetical protein